MREVLNQISSTKALWGIAAIVTALGSRHVISDLTDRQTELLSSPLVKRFIIFCVIFSATRDVLVAAMVATAVVLVLEYLTNEASQLCLLPRASAPKAQLDHRGAPAPTWQQHDAPPVARVLSSGAGRLLESSLDRWQPLMQGQGAHV